MAQLHAVMSTRTSDVVLRLHASLWSVAEKDFSMLFIYVPWRKIASS